MKDETSLASGVIEKIPNKYMAVIVSARRARALNDGARPMVKIGLAKPTTVAMEEIAAGAVVPGIGKPEVEVADEEQELLPSPGDSSDTEDKLENILEVEDEVDIEDEDEEDDEIEDQPEDEDDFADDSAEEEDE